MAKEIAKSLLDIEAVTLSPNDLYTWSSGINDRFTVITVLR